MQLPPGLRLSIEKNPSWEDRDLIDDGLGAYNAAFLRDNSYDYFGIFVRGDAGALRARPSGAAQPSAAIRPGSTRFRSRRPNFTGNSGTGNLPGSTTRPTTSGSFSKSG